MLRKPQISSGHVGLYLTLPWQNRKVNKKYAVSKIEKLSTTDNSSLRLCQNDRISCRNEKYAGPVWTGQNGEQVIHTYRGSYWGGGQEGNKMPTLTLEYLLPSQWLAVLAPRLRYGAETYPKCDDPLLRSMRAQLCFFTETAPKSSLKCVNKTSPISLRSMAVLVGRAK